MEGFSEEPIERSFNEQSNQDWSAEKERLLSRKISDMGLSVEGTRLNDIVQRLYSELETAGIELKPRVYLADEWGCPEGVPLIGMPFYLADANLARLEDEMMDGIEAESDEEILRYLRHEAGHAFNYAYRLYETEEWHSVFGPYSRPYREKYRPNPFSRNYVRHIPGWYAQKHPDEDFAETFAVWLTPDSNWREMYKDWGCYRKLLYMERMVKEYGRVAPVVSADQYDTSRELKRSVADHYRRFRAETIEVPTHFDGDLKDIFERKAPDSSQQAQWLSAHGFLEQHARSIVSNIHYWTGLNDTYVRGLVQHLVHRSRILQLWVDPHKRNQYLIEITAFATTLCMNKLYKGDFVTK